MDVRRFVKLTATDRWLTALQIVALLDEAGYWDTAGAQHTPGQRLQQVLHLVEQLTDADGAPCFASLHTLGSDGAPVLVYKQRRLILSRAPSPPVSAHGT